MSEDPAPYAPTTIEKVFELLDNKLVSLGVPGALSAVGVNNAKDGKWEAAVWCFVGAILILIGIRVGKKLAPKLDQGLDWILNDSWGALLNGWSALRSDFEGQYLKQQARLCEEYTTEGHNPDKTAIPLLQEVFVPLDLSGAMIGEIAGFEEGRLWQGRSRVNPDLHQIWYLLRRARQDRKFRQISIRAKGGMGKTTLLRHIALIYGLRQYRRYRAPNFTPVLLRLRDYTEQLTLEEPPNLATLITDFHLPSLFRSKPFVPPKDWTEKLLAQGKALVMLDGFDEIPEQERAKVSQWISAQMQDYDQAVFILTSRPAGFKQYVAKPPSVPVFINKFNTAQQADFIRSWYLCQERCFRSRKHFRQVAQTRSEELINQLESRRNELGHMAENPLLLNMLVSFHRFNPAAELPRQRLALYRGICKLQLDDRPRARGIEMLVSFEKSQSILQDCAFLMVKAKRFKVQRPEMMNFLNEQSVLKQEEVESSAYLKRLVDVSELLVEREPEEYEFSHLSFQGFFAASYLSRSEDAARIQANAQLILQNWNEAVWRETVLLYTAQLAPSMLNGLIPQACKLGSEAAELATLCLKEYPRPEKLDAELTALLDKLEVVVEDSKYKTLEDALKTGNWQAADEETYRLMITTVGKEEGQWFDAEDLLNFPCEELLAIDDLWVKYSKGKFGFSVQKKIYLDCGGIADGEYHGEAWNKFCHKVEWMKNDEYVGVKFNTFSPVGHLPAFFSAWAMVLGYGLCGRVVVFSRIETCKL